MHFYLISSDVHVYHQFRLKGYVTCILDDAKVYANHAKKKMIDMEDVKLASQMTMEKSFTAPPPREVSR